MHGCTCGYADSVCKRTLIGGHGCMGTCRQAPLVRALGFGCCVSRFGRGLRAACVCVCVHFHALVQIELLAAYFGSLSTGRQSKRDLLASFSRQEESTPQFPYHFVCACMLHAMPVLPALCMHTSAFIAQLMTQTARTFHTSHTHCW